MRKFNRKVHKALELAYNELNNRCAGIEGEATERQLREVIIPELEGLLEVKRYNMVPAEKRYLKSFAFAFKVWGWNMNSPTELFLILNELNSEYKKL